MASLFQSSKDVYRQQVEALESMAEAEEVTQGLGSKSEEEYNWLQGFMQSMKAKRAQRSSEIAESLEPTPVPTITEEDIVEFEAGMKSSDTSTDMPPEFVGGRRTTFDSSPTPEALKQPSREGAPSVDTSSNKTLDKPPADAPDAKIPMPAPPEVKEEGLMSDPRGNKRPKARPTDEVEDTSLSDDDMGLPTRSVPDYNFMLPDSKFRRALKQKEAESYSTIYANAQKTNTPFKDVDVTKMTMPQVLDFVKLNGPFHKYNKSKHNKNTTAIGKYQFVGATLRDLKKRDVFKKLGIDEGTLFDEDTQDKLSAYQAIHRIKDRSKGTFSSTRKEMRDEWAGFKELEDAELDMVIKEIADEIGVKITKAPSSELAPKTSIRPKVRPTN